MILLAYYLKQIVEIRREIKTSNYPPRIFIGNDAQKFISYLFSNAI